MSWMNRKTHKDHDNITEDGFYDPLWTIDEPVPLPLPEMDLPGVEIPPLDQLMDIGTFDHIAEKGPRTGKRPRFDWLATDFVKAVEAAKRGKTSLREICRTYDIPITSLRRALEPEKEKPKAKHTPRKRPVKKVKQKQPEFEELHEARMIGYVEAFLDLGFRIKRDVLLQKARMLDPDIKSRWPRSFFERNMNLNLANRAVSRENGMIRRREYPEPDVIPVFRVKEEPEKTESQAQP